MRDRNPVKVVCGEGRTKQSFKDECNINSIMAKYIRTGFIASPGDAKPRFGDFASLPTYHEAMTTIAKINGYFATLPSALRARFRNDPAELVAFMSVESNREEATSLGLVQPEKPKGDKTPVEGVKAAEAPLAGSTKATTPAPAAVPAA